MARTKRSWSPQEEEVLKKYVSECKTLTLAFEKTADKLGKTPKAVSQHYYYAKKHMLLLYKKNAQPSVSFFSRMIQIVRNLFI